MSNKQPGRAVGNTTRIIDEAIQELFTTGKVKIKDHYDNVQAHELVFDKVVRRLNIEHASIVYRLTRIKES